jgi:hypothetical protein
METQNSSFESIFGQLCDLHEVDMYCLRMAQYDVIERNGIDVEYYDLLAQKKQLLERMVILHDEYIEECDNDFLTSKKYFSLCSLLSKKLGIIENEIADLVKQYPILIEY